MFRVALLTKKGKYLSKNFRNKDKVDTWILELDEKEGVKRFRIMDKNKKEVIESEKGKLDNNPKK